SPSVLAAILDRERGGFFRVAPSGPCEIARRYVDSTNVLETTFRTATGVARTTDLMPVANEERKGRELWPEHEILRRIECLGGEVEMEVYYEPRLASGGRPLAIEEHPPETFISQPGADVLLLPSHLPFELDPGSAIAHARRHEPPRER